MAPVLSFTAEEAFAHLSASLRPDLPTVFALTQKDLHILRLSAEESARWKTLLETRAEITRAIEPLREAGEIGHGLDTRVTLHAGPALTADLTALGTDLRSLFIVSRLDLAPLDQAPASARAAEGREDLRISVDKAGGEKCARCWIYSTELDADAGFPGVCPRCAAVLRQL